MNEREQILTNLLSCRREELYVNPKPLTDEQQDQFNQMMARRLKGEPLQYILGDADFMGYKILVSPSVLIPRPETEILVDSAIDILKDRVDQPLRILDLGTGTGNIAISLAKFFKKATVKAVDVSVEALRMAKRNILLNNIEENIDLICSDMESYLKTINHHEKFDLVISNPPYIETSELKNLPEDVKREPRLALDGGWDGFRFYRMITEYCPRILDNNGFLFFEIGDNQDTRIVNLIKKYSQFKSVKLIKDYTGVNRVVFAQIN